MKEVINSCNCKNCGAPLHFNNKRIRCEYCGTEYELDSNEYSEKSDVIKGNCTDDRIVELRLHGRLKRFYIGEIEVNPIYYDDVSPYSYLEPYKQKRVEYRTKLTLIEMDEPEEILSV